MELIRLKFLPPEEILDGNDKVPLDKRHVRDLAKSIAKDGQLVPIGVMKKLNAWHLVFGRHRRAACLELKQFVACAVMQTTDDPKAFERAVLAETEKRKTKSRAELLEQAKAYLAFFTNRGVSSDRKKLGRPLTVKGATAKLLQEREGMSESAARRQAEKADGAPKSVKDIFDRVVPEYALATFLPYRKLTTDIVKAGEELNRNLAVLRRESLEHPPEYRERFEAFAALVEDRLKELVTIAKARVPVVCVHANKDINTRACVDCGGVIGWVPRFVVDHPKPTQPSAGN